MTQYRFILCKNFVPVKDLKVPATETPTITWDADAKSKRKLALNIEPESGINYTEYNILVQRVRDGQAESVGLFYCPTTEVTEDEYGAATMRLECYDLAYLVEQLCKVEKVTTIAAGTNVVEEVTAQLLACGVKNVRAEPCTDTLAADMEFALGTSRLEIITALLAAIGYGDLYFDGSGAAIVESLTTQAGRAVRFRYGKNGLPTYLNTKKTVDVFDTPNVFVAVCSSTDRTTDLTATAVNDRPDSFLSTVRRGVRIVKVLQQKDATGEEALQRIADAALMESMTGGDAVEFYSDADAESDHLLNELLEWDGAGGGVLKESGWELECIPGGKMKHSARKVWWTIDEI